MPLNAIINEIHRGPASLQQEMRAFQCHVNQELGEVKQNVNQLSVRIDALLNERPLQNAPNRHLVSSPIVGKKHILDLPPEILRMIFQRISATKDFKNCQKACEVYTDPLISNITSLIQFENEGIYSNIFLKICLYIFERAQFLILN